MYKTIGIIGGMGPAATCDLMKKIICQTDAIDDQHHIHIIIDCNTNIPDRTSAILHKGPSPVPELIKSAVRLECMGAQMLVMPCNTAHFFYDQITPYIDIPLLNMILETAKFLSKSNVSRVGILATDGTIMSGVYNDGFHPFGIETLYPSNVQQLQVMNLIYEKIKKGILKKELLPTTEMKEIIKSLNYKGAQKIILACTELPIAFSLMGIMENIIDPTMILARAAIVHSGATPIDSSLYLQII